MTRLLNQQGLLSQEEMDDYAIGIIGTGAIGSFVAMALTKMGFKNMVTWDMDKIEEHNIANQMFPIAAVGKRKAIATREMVKQFSGEDIICLATAAAGNKAGTYLGQAYPERVRILILCVDSLDVRRKIIEDVDPNENLTIIDARMGATTYRVMSFHNVDEEARAAYLAGLTSDADAVQDRCGMKSIIYTVLGVAAEVCAFVHYVIKNRHSMNQPDMPHPVTFDYGTGMRLQQRIVTGEVVTI